MQNICTPTILIWCCGHLDTALSHTVAFFHSSAASAGACPYIAIVQANAIYCVQKSYLKHCQFRCGIEIRASTKLIECCGCMYVAWSEPVALGFSCATATGTCGNHQHCKAYLGPCYTTLLDQQYNGAQDCVQFPHQNLTLGITILLRTRHLRTNNTKGLEKSLVVAIMFFCYVQAQLAMSQPAFVTLASNPQVCENVFSYCRFFLF